MSRYKKDLGDLGEKQAAKYLQENNYNIIETNYRCKLGEIDIIATDEDYIVFIEVKTRKNTVYGFPSEAVDYRKQMKIRKTAQYYLITKSISSGVRFDVVEIIGNLNRYKFVVKDIRIIKNAF